MIKKILTKKPLNYFFKTSEFLQITADHDFGKYIIELDTWGEDWYTENFVNPILTLPHVQQETIVVKKVSKIRICNPFSKERVQDLPAGDYNGFDIFNLDEEE